MHNTQNNIVTLKIKETASFFAGVAEDIKSGFKVISATMKPVQASYFVKGSEQYHNAVEELKAAGLTFSEEQHMA